MGRALTNEELGDIDEIMKEKGASRHDIAEHLKDMRNFKADKSDKHPKGIHPSELPEIREQQKRNEQLFKAR